jgi:hypothetical protein
MSAEEGEALVAGDFSTMRRIVRFLLIEIGHGNAGETECCLGNAAGCIARLFPGFASGEKLIRVLAKAA